MTLGDTRAGLLRMTLGDTRAGLLWMALGVTLSLSKCDCYGWSSLFVQTYNYWLLGQPQVYIHINQVSYERTVCNIIKTGRPAGTFVFLLFTLYKQFTPNGAGLYSL